MDASNSHARRDNGAMDNYYVGPDYTFTKMLGEGAYGWVDVTHAVLSIYSCVTEWRFGRPRKRSF